MIESIEDLTTLINSGYKFEVQDPGLSGEWNVWSSDEVSQVSNDTKQHWIDEEKIRLVARPMRNK